MSETLLLLHKELLQAVRDRRTVLLTVLFPLIFYPLMFWVMGAMVEREQMRLADLVPYVLLVAEELDDPLVVGVAEDPRLVVRVMANAEQALAAQRRAQADAALVIGRIDDAGELGYRVQIHVDGGDPLGQAALARLREVLQAQLQAIVSDRLVALGVDMEQVEPPFSLEVIDTADRASFAQLLFTRMLPYFLVLSILSGAMGFGAEITAGEKERGTISTLLSSRLSHRQIVMGKFLAVLTVALVSTVVSGIGLLVGILAFGGGIGGLGLSTAGWALLLLLPLAMALSAIVLIVGSYARTQKEASAYLVPLLMIIVLLGISLIVGVTDPEGMQFAIPVAGSLAAVQRALEGRLTLGEAGWALGSSVALAAVLLATAERVFRSERVLFRM